MQNSVMLFTFFLIDQKYPFCADLSKVSKF